MIIGTILYLLDFLMPQEHGGQTIILRTPGMFIFLYGYGILLLEKYRQGEEKQNPLRWAEKRFSLSATRTMISVHLES